MPDPVIAVNKPSLTIVRGLLPQGWAFFTKDPKESYTLLYQIGANNEISEFTYKSASMRNFFGFSRSARLVGGAVGQVMANVKPGDWEQGVGSISSITNFKPKTTIKDEVFLIPPGKYILLQRKPMPWAWYKRGQEENQPFLYSIIEIQK